jgi:putative transposase
MPGRLPKFDKSGSRGSLRSVNRQSLRTERAVEANQSLNHTQLECKYHIVFIPKYRRKVIYGQIRVELGRVLRELAQHKESEIEEGHLMNDHVQMLISIPPKYGVSQVMGYVKGKSAIHIARIYGGRKKNFVGQSFWARGYWVSTVGKNEAAVRRYIQAQDKEDKRLEQMELMAL